jgi:hypothetical protein
LTVGVLALALLGSGCATWDGMEPETKGLAAGATGGALVGGVIAGPIGAAIGAAGGGYAGMKSDTIQDAVVTSRDNPRVEPGVDVVGR